LDVEDRTDLWVAYGERPRIVGRPLIYLVFDEHDCGSYDCANDCWNWCPLGAFWEKGEAKEYARAAFQKIYGANIKAHRRSEGPYYQEAGDDEREERPETAWEISGVDIYRAGYEDQGVFCRVVVWPLCLVGTRRDRAKKWNNWEGEPPKKKRKLDIVDNIV
jgi:hypothetical protein